MKFGIHAGLWMANWTDDILPILRTVADLGFDGVEISLLGMSEERAQSLGSAIRDHGLEVTCSDGLSVDADITSSDPAVRSAGVAHLRGAIRAVEALGGRSLAGVVYAPWGAFDHARKQERESLSVEALSQIAPDLAEAGVTLGLEAINRFETDLINTAAEAVALAERTESAHIGALLDTFHMNIEEKDIRGAIAQAGDKIAHFHVSDNDRGTPGSGHVPWGDVQAGLKDADYDGWIVAEMFVKTGTAAGNDLNIWRDIEPDPTIAAKEALAFMQRSFA